MRAGTFGTFIFLSCSAICGSGSSVIAFSTQPVFGLLVDKFKAPAQMAAAGILLVAAILYAAVGRREFKPSIFGKANTLAQVSAVAAVLLHQLTSASWVVVFRMLALDATIALTVVSGLHYAWAVSRRGNSQASNGSITK